ncbi:thiol-disulfide oxidoreductase ResA [Novipirellula caenicola]|uniref:Thiol-disulfide oxidoreductase ResA n=2 Tax=Novipirellula caenicola TaxID=1536901 RepID=A0ABP9VZ25_9BACT
MRLWTAIFLAVCFGMPLEAADTAADAQPLPGAEFMELLAKKQIELTPAQAETLRKFLSDTKKEDELAEKLKGEASISIVEILPHIVNKDGCQTVLARLRDHPDVFLRFVANCGLAGSGDSDASEAIYTMLHDKHLNALDQRLLKSWALGAGINPAKDDSNSILQHLITLMGTTQKLKVGDECPSFAATTQSGVDLNFKTLKGKIIVLHFWSSSCAPCLAQMPEHIERLSKLSPDEAVVVFVSLDEDEKRFEASVEKYGMPFHNVCDKSGWGGTMARTFGVKQLPFDIVIDANGVVLSNSITELSVITK